MIACPLQEIIERSSQAAQYDTDDFAPYPRLVSYPGHHAVAPGKSQTDSVEADNAELCHRQGHGRPPFTTVDAPQETCSD